MIRQYVIWRNNHAYDGRLRRVVDRAFLHHQHLRRTTAPSASSYYYVGCGSGLSDFRAPGPDVTSVAAGESASPGG